MKKRVHLLVHGASAGAALVAAVTSPIPLLDELLLLPGLGALTVAVGAAHGLGATRLPWRAAAQTAVAGLVARAGLNLAFVTLPGVAAVANAASAVALCEAYGRWLDDACRDPERARGLSPSALRDLLRRSKPAAGHG